MKSITIQGKLRDELGTRSAKNLRKEGYVPCVIYGNGENIHFYTEDKSFKDILYTPEAKLIQVDIDGKLYDTIYRDAQYHPVSDEVEHVDLYHFDANNPITLEVPIRLIGTAKGVRNGGRMKVNLRRLPVRAKVENMPGMLEVNIEALRIGDALRVEDLDFEGIEILREPTRTILTIQTSRKAIITDADEEEGAEGEEAATEENAG